MKDTEMMWGLLLHLSYNMWSDRDNSDWSIEYVSAKPYLRFSDSLWDSLLEQAASAGANTIVVDLGDGVRYSSHPEIAVQGAWEPVRLKSELAKMRRMGLEPLPKLNFSACHDTWLGPYARMVSTSAYYQVCSDLIAEVCDLFDGPRLFHLGMDEETAEHQRFYNYVVIRQGSLWWDDLFFYLDHVQRSGARGWVWSDYVWHHPDDFYRLMPKSVLQSNWYYDVDFSHEAAMARAYQELDAHGYEQVPTGSNWTHAENMRLTVEHCQRTLAPERLAGFLMTIWKPTLEECRGRHEEGIACLAEARQAWLAGARG